MASIRENAKRVQDLRELLDTRNGQRNLDRSVLDRLGGNSAPANPAQSTSHHLKIDDDSFDAEFLRMHSDVDDESLVPVFQGLESRSDSSKVQQAQQHSEDFLRQTQEGSRGPAPVGNTSTTVRPYTESHSNSCDTEDELFRTPPSRSDDTLGAPVPKRRRLEDISNHIISQNTDTSRPAKNTGCQPVTTSLGNIGQTLSVVTPPEESTKVIPSADNLQQWEFNLLIDARNTGSSDAHLVGRNNSSLERPPGSRASPTDKDRSSSLINIGKQSAVSLSSQDASGQAVSVKRKPSVPLSKSLPSTSISVPQSSLAAGSVGTPMDWVFLTGAGCNTNIPPRSATGPDALIATSPLIDRGIAASPPTPQSMNMPCLKGTTTTHIGLLPSGSSAASALGSQVASTMHGMMSGSMAQGSVPESTSNMVESGSWKLPFPAPLSISEPPLEWFKDWIVGKDQVAVKNALLASWMVENSHLVFIKVIRSFTLLTLKAVLNCLFPFHRFRLSSENDLEGIEMAIKAFGAYRFGSEPKVSSYHVSKLMVAQLDHLLWALGFEHRSVRQYKREKVNTLTVLFGNRYLVDSHQISAYDLIVAGHLTLKPGPSRKGSEKTLDEILGNYGRACNPGSVLRFVPDHSSGLAMPMSATANIASPQSLYPLPAPESTSPSNQANARQVAGTVAGSPEGIAAAISGRMGPVQSNRGGKVVWSGTHTTSSMPGKPRSQPTCTALPGVSFAPDMRPVVKQQQSRASAHLYKSRGGRRGSQGKHSAHVTSVMVSQIKQFISRPSFDLGEIMNSDIFIVRPISIVMPLVFTISELGSYGSDKFGLWFQTPVPAIGLCVRCIRVNNMDHPLADIADQTRYWEAYPPGVTISLNGNMSAFDKPYTITTAKLVSPDAAGAARSNNVKIFLSHSSKKDHSSEIYCVFLCESSRRSLDEMTRALRAKSSDAIIQSLRPKVSNFRPSMSAVEVEKEFALAPMKNSELGISLATISLKCSLSFVRIRVPARGKACQHFQCFDLAGFVDLFIQSGANKCPICSQRIDMNSLIISPFFEALLHKHGDLDEIEMLPSGETKARGAKNTSFVTVSHLGSNVVDLTGDEEVPLVVSKSKPPKKPLEVIIIDD